MRILTFIFCLVSISALAEITPEQFEQIKKKAEQGYAPAQCDLGLYYFAGDGVLKNYGLSIFWLRKSAEQGWAPANAIWGYVTKRVSVLELIMQKRLSGFLSLPSKIMIVLNLSWADFTQVPVKALNPI
jgi:TPR repeat protein